MKLRHIIIGMGIILSPTLSFANINILACEPEWKALALEIGGKHINVHSATSPMQDPHHIRARPSLIAKARRTDMFFCSGASLEIGWLPILLQQAKAEVQPGTDGYFLASRVIPVLEIPLTLDRSLGDIHPNGNPHIHLNPYNILLIADAFLQRIQRIDPENASDYQHSYNDFIARWKDAIKKWEDKASPLKGKKIIVHHRSFSYLINWLQMQQLGSLEPVPGIPPTTSHLEKLLKQSKHTHIDMILRSPFDPENASKWLSQKTGAPAVLLPYTVGGDKESHDLFSLFDHTIDKLIQVSHAQ